MAKAEEAQRTCIATGETLPRGQLLRFVVSPEHKLVFDIRNKLPGRGIWLVPNRIALHTAMTKKLFPRAAKESVMVPPDMPEQVARQLRSHALEILSLCRKSGILVAGFEKVREALHAGATVLVHASDAGEDGVSKLGGHAVENITCFTRDELGQVTARENAVHLALQQSPLSAQFVAATRRLTGFAE